MKTTGAWSLIDGFVQERHNSIANALELSLSSCLTQQNVLQRGDYMIRIVAPILAAGQHNLMYSVSNTLKVGATPMLWHVYFQHMHCQPYIMKQLESHSEFENLQLRGRKSHWTEEITHAWHHVLVHALTKVWNNNIKIQERSLRFKIMKWQHHIHMWM